MSIFGSRDTSHDAPDIMELTGDLDMKGHVIRGLPIAFPPLSTGDSAVSWRQVMALFKDVTRLQPKSYISVCAEERSRLTEGRYQWSFGDGLNNGVYTMTAPGKLLRMGLSTTSSGEATVAVIVNGQENSSHTVFKHSNKKSATSIFSTPLEVQAGDQISFKTISASPRLYGGNVTLLIELKI